MSGTYLFGTLIALLKQGRPVLGIIHQPIVGESARGHPRRDLAQRPARAGQPCDRVEDAILLATDHWNVYNHQDGPAFEALDAARQAVQQLGRLPRLLPGGDRRRPHHGANRS